MSHPRKFMIMIAACAAACMTISVNTVRAEAGPQASPSPSASPEASQISDASAADTRLMTGGNPQECTIRFNTVGADPIADVKLECGSYYELPYPSQPDSEFWGWKGQPDSFQKNHIVEQDMSLTAVWVVFVYQLRFHNPDGTVSTVQVDAGDTPPQPANPAGQGYDFGGWYTEPEFTSLFDLSKPIKGQVRVIDLYPKITQSVYTLDFQCGFTGSGDYLYGCRVIDPITVSSGTAVTLPKDETVIGTSRIRDGSYSFVSMSGSAQAADRWYDASLSASGWSTEGDPQHQGDASAVSYQDGETITPWSSLRLYPHATISSRSPRAMILPGYPDDGYDYEGWYTARDGGTRVGGAGDELDFSEHPDWFQDTYYAHGTLRPATPDPNAGKSSDVSVKTLTVTDSAGNVITPVKAADTLYDVYVSRDCTSVRLNVTPASDKAAVSFEDYAWCQDENDPSVFHTDKSVQYAYFFITAENGSYMGVQVRIWKDDRWKKISKVTFAASNGVSYPATYSSTLNAMTVTVSSKVSSGDVWVTADSGIQSVSLQQGGTEIQQIDMQGTTGSTEDDLTLANGTNAYTLTPKESSGTAGIISGTGILQHQLGYARLKSSGAALGKTSSEEQSGSDTTVKLYISRIPDVLPIVSLAVNGMQAAYSRNLGMYVANVPGSAKSAEIAAEYSSGVASAMIDGHPSGSGQAVTRDSLKQGDNLVWIEVSKSDGSTEKYLLDIMQFPTVTSLEMEGGEVIENLDGSVLVRAAAGDDDPEVTVNLDDLLESGVQLMVDGKPYSLIRYIYEKRFLLDFSGLTAGTHHAVLLAAGTDLVLKKFDLVIPEASHQARRNSAAGADSLWCITYLDCLGNTVSVQQVKTGAAPARPAGFDYPDISNVSAHQDVRPLSCSADMRYIIPDTGDRGR